MSNREPEHVLKTLGHRLNIVGALIGLIIVLAVAWLHWGPLSREMDESKRRLDSLQALLDREHQLRSDHAAIRRQLENAIREDAAIQKRIPSEPQEAEFLGQISQAAADVGLQIADYRPGVMSAGKICSSLRVELACTGKYQAICKLLDRLQELSRYSKVTRLEIGPSSMPEHYSAKLCLELYFFNNNHTLASK